MKAHRRIKRAVMALLASVLLAGSTLPALAVEDAGQIIGVESWTKYAPNNELEIPAEKLSGFVIAGKMTSNRPMVIWTEKELEDDEKEAVFASLKGNPGVGNPKDAVYISGNGATANGMTVDSENGVVYFEKTSNWSLIYGGTCKVEEPEVTEPDTEPEQEHESVTEPETETGTEVETEPETESEPENESEPEGETEPESGSEPEGETEPETEERTELDGENEPEHDTLPEETVTGNEPEEDIPPEVDTVPEADPQPKEETAPITDAVPEEKTGSTLGSTGSVSHSFDGVVGKSGYAAGSVNSSAVNAGPGAGVHVPENEPDAGLADNVQVRQLDDTPKTGMPAEFTVLLAISLIAMLSLAVVLIVEKRLRAEENER